MPKPQDQIKKIQVQITNHEHRISELEQMLQRAPVQKPDTNGAEKEITLAELTKGKDLKSSQKIALIVGYKERILIQGSSSRSDIREYWINEKINGTFRTNLIDEAKKAGLIREVRKDSLDLSQSGEKFFDELIYGKST